MPTYEKELMGNILKSRFRVPDLSDSGLFSELLKQLEQIPLGRKPKEANE